MQTNLRFGCVILRHYIDRERGDLFMALGRYNGSRGKPQYPNAVLGAGKQWAWRDLPGLGTSPDPSKPPEKAPGGP
jgi:soluble lytic murein transglycosylase-like protein